MRAPKNIIDIIVSNKTSLGDNPALPPETIEKFLVFLVNDYYDELSLHFDSIDIDEITNDLNKSLTECKKIESNNKEALEMLCSNIIKDLFEIPNGTLVIDMKLVSNIDTDQVRMVPEDSKDYSFDSIEDMNNLTQEVYKRRLLNALTIGAAMYYAEQVNVYADELVKIDNRLPYLYKKIMCINNLLLFHTNHIKGQPHTDGGKVDVYLNNEQTPVKIKAEGLIFPILLEETIKGILELSIAHGLPRDRQKANYITSKADFKLAEIWDQRLGLPLWKRIKKVMDNIDESPIEVGLNFIFMELSQLKPIHFNSTMQEIFAGTKVGNHILKKISNDIQYQKERDEFDDYMTQQQNDNQYPLNDDNFTSDELINDDLCASAVLDEMDY